MYRRWPRHVGDVEICPVQLPGRENRMRETLPRDMHLLARELADELDPWLDHPYALFGHCLGGRIGYAVATELAGRRAPAPVTLFASSCLAPHHGGRFGPYLPEMTTEQYVAQLTRGARAQGLPDPDPELATLAVRLLRADVELSCRYAPPGPTGAPLLVTTVAWTDDHDVTADEMADWSAYGPVTSHVLPGDEFSILFAPAALLQLVAGTFSARPALADAAESR